LKSEKFELIRKGNTLNLATRRATFVFNCLIISILFSHFCLHLGIGEIAKIDSLNQQEITQIFSKTYGEYGSGRAVIETSDGGFAITGYLYNNRLSEHYIWYSKLDSMGNLQWNRTYISGGQNYGGKDIIQTDTGYFILGEVYSEETSANILLLKTDFEGTIEWSKTYGGINSDVPEGFILTNEGVILILANTFSYGAGAQDIWILKTDLSGELLEAQTFGGNENEEAREIIQTEDGGFAIAAYTRSNSISDSKDILLLKIDENVTLQWNATYGDSEDEEAWAIAQLQDRGFIIAGYTGLYSNTDIILISTFPNGTKKWSHTYGGNGAEVSRDLILSNENKIILIGKTTSWGLGSTDLWVLGISSKGILEWNQTFGSGGSDNGLSLIQTFDEEYVITGNKGSNIWLLKITDKENQSLFESTSENRERTGELVEPLISLLDNEFKILYWNFSLLELILFYVTCILIGITSAWIYQSTIKKK
jgi:hypothetical protein